MLNFHKSHKNLVVTSLLVFLGLSTLIAVIPAYELQKTQPLPTMKDLSPEEKAGLRVYVAENCVACHTQQVRNIEMDKIWGDRPSIASDYYYSKKRMDFWRQSPSVLGSERTGPDLTNIGKRQPGKDWHLLHLYNPRIVVKESIMPGYPWLFQEKDAGAVSKTDVVIPVPENFLKNKSKKIVATQSVLNLVSYLQSLKQADIQNGMAVNFIPSKQKNTSSGDVTGSSGSSSSIDGEKLYMNTCAACHQQDGKGLAGAFPPLAGSQIVNDDNPDTHIRIILQGYDARPEYTAMPPFGSSFTDEEVAAIVNHERNSWGNKGKSVTADDVKKIRELVTTLNQ